MAYEVVDPYGEDPLPDRPCETHAITGQRGAEGRFRTLGVRVYDVEPGEQMPLKYHYHEKQEEAFYVLDGELHVETPEGEFVAAEGELFLAEPGNPHRAFNPDDAAGPIRVLAMGAPSSDPGKAYDPDAE
ncbi:MAG: cupin domain-containing protein [Salinigranum sp.]